MADGRFPVTAASGADQLGAGGEADDKICPRCGWLGGVHARWCEHRPPQLALRVPASGADQPTLRDQLAEERRKHRPRYEQTRRTWGDGSVLVGCICGWDGTDTEGHQLDALLPLIEAREERAKAEGGAEALERLAMIAKPDSGLLGEITRSAASLRAAAGQPPDGGDVR